MGGMAEMVVIVPDCNCFSWWQGFDGLSWLNGPNHWSWGVIGEKVCHRWVDLMFCHGCHGWNDSSALNGLSSLS